MPQFEITGKRPSKIEYYLGIAEAVLKRGTCLRRNYGAVIVKDDMIISTGYSGSPRGSPNCIDVGNCPREEAKIPSGQRYELCKSIHAEENAIISASRRDLIDSVLYLSGSDAKTGHVIEAEPCIKCKRYIINAGIEKVVMKKSSYDYGEYLVSETVSEVFDLHQKSITDFEPRKVDKI